MLSKPQLTAFHDRGFVLGNEALTDEQVGVLQQEVERVIRDRNNKNTRQPVSISNLSKPETPVWQIVNIWAASDPFYELISNSQIVEDVAQLTEASELRIWHDQIQYKPSGTGGVNMWHQDAPYWPILEPKNQMLTAWVALDDVDEDNGCMRMVPGSHRWGDQIQFLHKIESFDAMPAEFEGQKLEVVSCPVPKGVVHFHHSLTWHGSGANTSGRPRRAIALHYLNERIHYKAAGGHLMKQFVTVADGEVLRGDKFPLVYDRTAEPVA
ncbi:MAG TPA: phytanoyl-CoA dioxygenase family protein [Tepidisphaeraceae bacterium]|jgi:ectoine hydroxylase-related dioxygenase (phytanoyl-CoA dioxygenase family)|nr:phytanoyl-CoA dioxygenase family protein [Tepidisphaeraceae bacterium]